MSKKCLSQQICEECGIEPYYGIYIEFGDLDINYQLVTNKRKYRLIADYRHYVDNEQELKNIQRIYIPDLEEENFSKLFNLKYTQYDDDTVANFIFLRYRNVMNTRSFLGCLLFELRHGKYKEAEQIKQAIKNTQWRMQQPVNIQDKGGL